MILPVLLLLVLVYGAAGEVCAGAAESCRIRIHYCEREDGSAPVPGSTFTCYRIASVSTKPAPAEKESP